MLRIIADTGLAAAHIRRVKLQVNTAIGRCMERIAIWLQRDIKDNALEGQILQHRSGKLTGSIRSWVEMGDHEMVAWIQGGGGVAPYGAVHEFGGTFTIPAHIAQRHAASARRMRRKGIDTVADTWWTVREHTATFPERSFMRSRLHENEGMFLSWIERAVSESLQT